MLDAGKSINARLRTTTFPGRGQDGAVLAAFQIIYPFFLIINHCSEHYGEETLGPASSRPDEQYGPLSTEDLPVGYPPFPVPIG